MYCLHASLLCVANRFEVHRYKVEMEQDEPVFYGGADDNDEWHRLSEDFLESSVPGWEEFKNKLMEHPGTDIHWTGNNIQPNMYVSDMHCTFYSVSNFLYANDDKKAAHAVAEEAPAMTFNVCDPQKPDLYFKEISDKIQRCAKQWTLRRRALHEDSALDWLRKH